LTAVNTLLETYTLLQAVPSSALAHENAQRACREVVETLLAYTQPVQPDAGAESDALARSLWTQMVAEVSYTSIT